MNAQTNLDIINQKWETDKKERDKILQKTIGSYESRISEQK